LFWPALLALLLLALAAGVVAIRWALTAVETLAVEAPAVEAPAAVEASGPPSEARPPGDIGEGSPAELAVELPAEPPSLPPPAAEPPPPDPLLSALGEMGASSLLQAASAEPARSLLVLTASAAYTALPLAERQERAEGWWRQGQELGYERLEVQDGRGRLLARSALVGGGLVLFEPPTAGAGADPA
jgi:hypothetical protein